MPSQKKSPSQQHAQQPGRQASSADGNRPATGWHSYALASVLVAMVCATYLHTLQSEFIWDDETNITNNVTLRTWDGLYRMWFIPGATQQYYPLMYTSYWLEYHLWGLAPLGYHVVNVLLHALCCLLVWRLLTRLQVPGAWLAAALFAVHPVMVESVAWVTERKNVLSLALALTSILAYLRCDPPEESRAATDDAVPTGDAAPTIPVQGIHWNWYALSLVLFGLALAAKTVVVTLPPVLLVIYWWKRGRIGLADVLRMIPFFAIAVGMGQITIYMETEVVGAKGEEWSLSPLERLLLAGRALWFYVGKLVWPHPIAYFYPRFTIDAGAWWQYLYPLAVVAALAGLWLARKRMGRGPLAAALIFAGVVAPMLGFFDIFYMRYAYVSDHFQYHACVALLALAAAGATLAVARLAPTQQMLARAGAGVLLVVLAVLSYRQTPVYDNLETLYGDIILKNPDSWVAYNNLSTYLDGLGRDDEALELAHTAIALKPTESHVHTNLANLLAERSGLTKDRHMRELALAHYREAIRLNPTLVDNYTCLGYMMLEDGSPEALSFFQRALELDPRNFRAQYGIGAVHEVQGDAVEAQLCYLRAWAINPEHPQTNFSLAMRLLDQGKSEEAIKYLQTAIQFDPNFAEAHFALGGALMNQGDLAGATQHFGKTLQLQPRHLGAMLNLGRLLANRGDAERGAQLLRSVVAEDPNNVDAHLSLAMAWARQGKASDAAAEFQIGLKLDPQRADGYFEFGNLLAGQKDLRQAANCYAEAVRLRPDYVEALQNLGAALLTLGDTDQAVKYLSEALRLQPENPQARANLEQARNIKSAADK